LWWPAFYFFMSLPFSPGGGGRGLKVIAPSVPAGLGGPKAGDLVRTAAKTLGGGGGGKPDVAQGGGQDPEAIGAAVEAVERLVVETA
ncbi:DHHA1 domain-containing protein, partial [Streptomyces sp. Act-28]